MEVVQTTLTIAKLNELRNQETQIGLLKRTEPKPTIGKSMTNKPSKRTGAIETGYPIKTMLGTIQTEIKLRVR